MFLVAASSSFAGRGLFEHSFACRMSKRFVLGGGNWLVHGLMQEPANSEYEREEEAQYGDPPGEGDVGARDDAQEYKYKDDAQQIRLQDEREQHKDDRSDDDVFASYVHIVIISYNKHKRNSQKTFRLGIRHETLA